MIECFICHQHFSTKISFARHLKSHNIKPSDYYKQVHPEENHICPICGNESTFISLYKGFNETCSRTCSATLFRKRLKEDETRYNAFINKVSVNQEQIWKERKETGEDKIIFNKCSATNRENIAKMTVEERRQRYGWLNKLSEDEKKVVVNDILDKSLRKFWREASEETLLKLYEKRSIAIRKHDYDDLSLFETYCALSRKMTYINYKKYKNLINPSNLPIGHKLYHIDHRVSLINGFVHKIPIEIISSHHNLQMLYYIDNASKNYRSDMPINELFEKCGISEIEIDFDDEFANLKQWFAENRKPRVKKGKPPKIPKPKVNWKEILWWNNGKINKRSKECPGEGFVRGRLSWKGSK